MPEAHLFVINCPNPSCHAANPEGNEFCQVCHAALPHRYLWGVGDLVATLKPDALINQRYLFKSVNGASPEENCIFLDTQPGLVPESLPELPNFLLPYLHLSAYPLHVPRPYTMMRTPHKDYVLMLESSALAMVTGDDLSSGMDPLEIKMPRLLPKLSECWVSAPPLRQLSWLWQIAQLWDAFQAEQVAATLLNDSFLRVDGSILRLLALDSPPGMSAFSPQQTLRPGQETLRPEPSQGRRTQPTLMDLARSWQPLVESAHQSIRTFLDRLCDRIERQQLNAEQMSERLSQAMSESAQAQVVGYDLAVFTDQGPTRKRNEDACYPPNGTVQTLTSEHTKASPQLLIVCDGIGGHQGGDVASKLAIATIESRLKPLLSNDRTDLTATELSLAIEAAICAANDEISAQNDQAQRQARDRMGTTLVLALIKGADVYIAHLGDSRAYRISQHNCQQVTLDDDVASRQVRLGGSLYREVLLQPGSGSLVQALGMSSSQMLRPTVQRFVMDEDCVFLLCSDGLSDSDRVEQFWRSEIRPLLLAEKSTAKTGKRLVELANKYNGHDNVTIGLLTAKVLRASERMVPRDLAGDLTGNLTENRAGNGTEASASQSEITTLNSQNNSQKLSRQDSQGRKRGASRGNTKLTPPPSAQNPSDIATDFDQTRLATHSTSRQTITAKTQPLGTASTPQKIGAILALLAALGGALYFLVGSGSTPLRSLFPWSTASGDRETNQTGTDSAEDNSTGANPPASANPGDTPRPPGEPAPADVNVGNYIRIRQSDFPGIVSSAPAGSASKKAEGFSQLKLYPKPSTAQREIPGIIPTGGIAYVVEQVTAESTTWVKLKLCSIPSGASIADIPAETDAPATSSDTSASLNVSAPDEGNQPLILSPDHIGWAVKSSVAAVSENISNLEPSQQGTCGS